MGDGNADFAGAEAKEEPNIMSRVDPFVRRGPAPPEVIVRHVQVGWLGPYGIIPGGMDNEPAPHWEPIYVIRRETR